MNTPGTWILITILFLIIVTLFWRLSVWKGKASRDSASHKILSELSGEMNEIETGFGDSILGSFAPTQIGALALKIHAMHQELSLYKKNERLLIMRARPLESKGETLYIPVMFNITSGEMTAPPLSACVYGNYDSVRRVANNFARLENLCIIPTELSLPDFARVTSGSKDSIVMLGSQYKRQKSTA